MSATLPWSIVIPYAILSVFATQQKFAAKEFQGASKLYESVLVLFMAATSLFAIGFLITYGIKVSWWAPFVLFVIGMIAWIPAMLLERFVPVWIWALASFPAVPVCAYVLIRNFP